MTVFGPEIDRAESVLRINDDPGRAGLPAE